MSISKSFVVGPAWIFFIAGLCCGVLLTKETQLGASIGPNSSKTASNLTSSTGISGNESNSTNLLVIDLTPSSTGGKSEIPISTINRMKSNPRSYGIYDDLKAFTGLSDEELYIRLRRLGKHHFSVEHRFSNPNSSAELALYYRSSIGYLWANAIHPGVDTKDLKLTPEDGPILDYSGGVGSSCLSLALNGIKCIYFGIGLMEFSFARFRARRHKVEHMITFIEPFANDEESGKGLIFDSFKALKLGKTVDEKLGGVFVFDVFEHIPNYHILAKRLVSLIRDGGKLYEITPFGKDDASDVDIHLQASMPLDEALKGMSELEKIGKINVWIRDYSLD